MYAFEIIHRRHQISTKHGSNMATCMQNTAPLCKLVLAIPRADNILHTRVEARFEEAHEKANDI